MAGGLDTCITNVFEPGNIPASSGETPVRVPLPPTLKRTVLEAAAAAAEQDATAVYTVMFMVEAANASDAVDGELEFIARFADVVEAATATDDPSATVTGAGSTADVVEAATATDDPSATVTAAPSDDWTLVDSWTHSGNVAQVDFTGLAGYTEVRVLIDGVSATAGFGRQLLVSTDNGSTFMNSSGDYVSVSSAGVESSDDNITFTSSTGTAAQSGEIMISGWNLTTLKNAEARTNTTTQYYIIPTTTALNALRVSNESSGNLSAGSIYVYAR